MYVTLVQNISASMRSVSSLCDSLKHLNLIKLIRFFLRTFLLLVLLCMKREHFSYAYISTKSIPAPSLTWLAPTGDKHWSPCLVTHPMQTNSSAVLSHTCIYLTHPEKLIQYTPKSLSFILNKNKINLTIKFPTLSLFCVWLRFIFSARMSSRWLVKQLFNCFIHCFLEFFYESH